LRKVVVHHTTVGASSVELLGTSGIGTCIIQIRQTCPLSTIAVKKYLRFSQILPNILLTPYIKLGHGRRSFVSAQCTVAIVRWRIPPEQIGDCYYYYVLNRFVQSMRYIHSRFDTLESIRRDSHVAMSSKVLLDAL
jgi:hypothetical protein